MLRYVFLLSLPFIVLFACKHDNPVSFTHYQTQNVFVIVIDGPRYSETWGAPLRENIPVRDSLLSEGVLITNFRNNGTTFTNPGHAAICTGNYENIANNGSQYPTYPSFMHLWLKSSHELASKCCVIASKDKLHILTNCTYPSFQNQYRPYFDCGVNGDGTGGYRADSVTFAHIINTLDTKRPRLLVVNFKDPDYYGHLADSLSYIEAIRKTDQYVGKIWAYIQSNPHYKDKTTLIVTNDHGRHLNGIANGYVSHGDDCEGCRHVEFFALSPDFKQNTELTTVYEQIDISATISELLHFSFVYGKGHVMTEIFQ